MQHESDMVTCPSCNGPQIEIDHYGERFIGCIECNRWSWRGGNRLFMELPEEDLQALRELVTNGRQARSIR
jgi:hypothetical protein